MPRKPHSKSVVTRWNAPYATQWRQASINIAGNHNKPEWPTRSVESPLSLQIHLAYGCSGILNPNESYRDYQCCDAPNAMPSYQMMSQSWNERLYAGVYAKFADAARQGSAEWGMNIVQGRKALDTFVQLALTSATTLAAFSRVHRKPLEWLRANPKATPRSIRRKRLILDRQLRLAREREERRRISNAAWILDQVSGTLLAYRYGVAPLMSDLASTAEILSKEFDDKVALRKSGKIPWNGPSGPENGPWTGHESVVLRATVSCHNPNLLLANRLGIINPQMWLWDATPWSFIVDWWFPVGSFLSSFTAMVGLTLDNASVTRTRSYNGTWHINKAFDYMPRVYNGDRILIGKRKERTLGSLPIPLAVPYGTGLGIQRGQNALALCAQLLKGKIPK